MTGVANWDDVVKLYDVLLSIDGSPVVEINRALASQRVESRGVKDGLAAMPNHESDARLADYQPYWAARAELLARAGQREQAHRAYELAIGLSSDPAVRAVSTAPAV